MKNLNPGIKRSKHSEVILIVVIFLSTHLMSVNKADALLLFCLCKLFASETLFSVWFHDALVLRTARVLAKYREKWIGTTRPVGICIFKIQSDLRTQHDFNRARLLEYSISSGQ